jgi:hypothetical protein
MFGIGYEIKRHLSFVNPNIPITINQDGFMLHVNSNYGFISD